MKMACRGEAKRTCSNPMFGNSRCLRVRCGPVKRDSVRGREGADFVCPVTRSLPHRAPHRCGRPGLSSPESPRLKALIRPQRQRRRGAPGDLQPCLPRALCVCSHDAGFASGHSENTIHCIQMLHSPVTDSSSACCSRRVPSPVWPNVTSGFLFVSLCLPAFCFAFSLYAWLSHSPTTCGGPGSIQLPSPATILRRSTPYRRA